MTKLQYRLESASGSVTITNTTASKTALGIPSTSTINLGGGTQNLTVDGWEFTASATGQFNIGRVLATAPSDVMSLSGQFTYTGAGTGGAFTATNRIGAFTTATAGVYPVQFRVPATNVLAPQDSAGLTITAVGTPTAMVPGTDYLIDVFANRTAGSASVKLSSADGSTVLGNWTRSSLTLGDGAITGVELGHSTANQTGTVKWHRLTINDGLNAFSGPWVDPVASLAVSCTVSPSTGPVPRLDGTGGTTYFVNLDTTGGNGNAVTYAILVERTNAKDGSGNWDFTSPTTFLAPTFGANPTFTFTPTAEGGYRVTPKAQQAA